MLVDWLKDQGVLLKTTDGILSIRQSDQVVDHFQKYLESLDPFTLAAFEKAVMSTKSFVIAYALIQKRINVEFAAKAGRLEVLHQIEKWGEVEDSHDTDREDLQRQLGAVTTVLI